MLRETRPSLGPSTRARQSSLTRGGQTSRGEAFVSASRLGKPTQVGGTSTGVGRAGVARLAACHRFAEKSEELRGTREKEGGQGLRPCEETRVPVELVARRVSLQKSAGDVWPRISSANALQKERSGSSERGPSSERWLAGQTVGSRVGRRGSRESASPLRRARIGARPTVARERHQRQQHRQKRCSCRGTGVVMATGSYEGYLLMEGTPGHHEASSFTRGAHGWSWRSSAPSDPCLLAKSRRPRSPCSSREGE
jgi:hypothetical protein